MASGSEPLVAVVTPVFNAAPFLAESIESVLSQTYTNFQYIIFDDFSTDGSPEIALRYARQDSRIKFERTRETIGVMPSHNAAFRLIPSAAKYCKVVAPEDVIFPDCLKHLIALAEANPSVGVVGSYQLFGGRVRWQGFTYPNAVLSGSEMCRRVFLEGDSGFGFGSPTSMLYRADVVRASDEFYPDAAPHSDASACFNCLRDTDYGFVYEVLSYGRIHRDLVSANWAAINEQAPASLRDLVQYGPVYLQPHELHTCVTAQVDDYNRFLAVNVLSRRGKAFWTYHRNRRQALGYPVTVKGLLAAGSARVLRGLLNPGNTLARVWQRVAGRRTPPAASV